MLGPYSRFSVQAFRSTSGGPITNYQDHGPTFLVKPWHDIPQIYPQSQIVQDEENADVIFHRWGIPNEPSFRPDCTWE